MKGFFIKMFFFLCDCFKTFVCRPGLIILWFVYRPVVLKWGYVDPWGYVKALRGVREIFSKYVKLNYPFFSKIYTKIIYINLSFKNCYSINIQLNINVSSET